MLPARFAPYLFGLILSGVMSCIVSGLSTLRAIGFVDGVVWDWMSSWSFCWPIAFAVVLIVAPVTRRLVNRLVDAQA